MHSGGDNIVESPLATLTLHAAHCGGGERWRPALRGTGQLARHCRHPSGSECCVLRKPRLCALTLLLRIWQVELPHYECPPPLAPTLLLRVWQAKLPQHECPPPLAPVELGQH